MRNARGRILTAVAVATLLAAPAAADAIAGCAMPLIPRPDELTERQWDARGLVMFIQKNGVLELRGDRGEVLEVQPVFKLTGSGGREELAQGKGRPVRAEVGKYPIGKVGEPGPIDGIFDQITDALMNLAGNSTRLEVIDVRTLEHDRAPKYPPEHGVVALTLEYVNLTSRGTPASSHKLVLFLSAIGETEKNLRR